jgi:hypothetical protein
MVADIPEEEVAEQEVDAGDGGDVRATAPRSPKKPPKVIPLDLAGDPSFAQFAAIRIHPAT